MNCTCLSISRDPLCPFHGDVDKVKATEPSIMADVLKMVETLQNDTKYGAHEMYLPDVTLRAMGYDPNDYPELEGYPGVRVVKAK